MGKKKSKKYNKINYYTSSFSPTATPQQIHQIAFQIFGSSYYVDYEALTTP